MGVTVLLTDVPALAYLTAACRLAGLALLAFSVGLEVWKTIRRRLPCSRKFQNSLRWRQWLGSTQGAATVTAGGDDRAASEATAAFATTPKRTERIYKTRSGASGPWVAQVSLEHSTHMNTPEQMNAESIRELMNTQGPCITLALAGDEAQGMKIQLKDAIAAITKEMRQRQLDPDELLAPISAIAGNVFRDLAGRAMVILRSPSLMRVHRLARIRPIARVDEHFDLRTVLSVEAAQRLFHVVALSQNRTRILQCTEEQLREIPFPEGFPASLGEMTQTRQPDHNLDNRASGGPSMGGGAVVFGTSSDRDDKDEYMLHFFMEIDKAVNSVLKHSSQPLVAVGVEHEIALYRRVNTYAHLVEPGVHGAPDGLGFNEIYRRCLELLDERHAEVTNRLLEGFDKKVGTDLASTHIQEIVVAAHQGRVSHLFFQEDAHYPGVFDPVRQRVKHTENPLDSPVDLIDSAAYQTLIQDGEVKLLPGSLMPNGVPVCALYRYRAAQAPSETAEPLQTGS